MKHAKIVGVLPSYDHAACFGSGGLVGAVHDAMEVDCPAITDWATFSDPLPAGERFIQAISRGAGIAALIGGVAVTFLAIVQLF